MTVVNSVIPCVMRITISKRDPNLPFSWYKLTFVWYCAAYYIILHLIIFAFAIWWSIFLLPVVPNPASK